jgi:hypothetical protein
MGGDLQPAYVVLQEVFLLQDNHHLRRLPLSSVSKTLSYLGETPVTAGLDHPPK